MKALAPVLAGIAVISGIVSASLWRELRAERLTNEELRTQLAESRIAGHQPVAAVQPAAAPLPTGALPATAAASPPTSGPAPATAEQARATAAAATNSLISTLSSTLSIGSNDRDLMKDPEYRKARLAQLRIQLARSNPGLAEELGLSEREANQLFELMASNQLNLTTELTATTGTGTGTTDVAARVQQLQARTREQTEAIRTMLGPAKYAQYQQYQQTLPARNQVVTMGSQLAAAGQPLSDAQSRALTTVMIAEQQRPRQQAPLPSLSQGAADPQQRTAQILEESLRRQEETNRNVLDAASAHLTAGQLATLRQQFDQQNASRRQTLTRLQETSARLQIPAIPAAPPPSPQ
jgi:hypothetical protein